VSLTFRVLGSFEVHDEDGPLALGGLKQRAVLAVLALTPGRSVSADRLIDEVWGAEPPRQAAASLQAYVSNLRRVLEPGRAAREPARVLGSNAGGYVLLIDPDDVDAHRFERLAEAGRALLRNDRPEAARQTLAQALGLWRGPPLSEFREQPTVRTEAARLAEVRIEALEARVSADLALGEHASVVPELQRLVVDEPLREQLWTHLMLALYRSGRQSDALAAYQQCRRRLDADIGIEPHPALRQLEANILRQSPSLDWVPPSASTPRRSAAASLAYQDGSGSLQVFPLTAGAGRVTVGREETSDVWLFWDNRVSRLHAELESDGDRWVVCDDGLSSNGSYVNGERVRGRRALEHDDELRVGNTRLTFRVPAESAAAQTYLGTNAPPT
jgi:DNA-binding SARP family transcriptional activator